MLTCDQVYQIELDMALGLEPSITSPEADKLRKDIQDELTARGLPLSSIDIEYEIPDINADAVFKGGKGSGFHGHSGRPGQRGGSMHDGTNPESKKNLIEFINFVTNMQDNSIYGVVKKYGKFYHPQTLPKGIKRGKPKNCYMNAWKLSQSSGMQYVEGLAMPDFMDIPIEHAWCVDAEGNVFDNTWPKPGRVYYGVPFADKFVSSVMSETGTYGVIDFHSPTFRKRYAVGDLRDR